MAKHRRFLSKPSIWFSTLLLLLFLVWGGRHAYCHLRNMPGYSPDRLAAAEERLPLVTVVEPIQKPAVRYVTLPASVEAYEKATLYAKVAGYLKWIKVDKGDLVRKGDILAFIEIPEMTKDYQRAQAAVQEAQASYERAQANAVLKELTFKRLDGIRKSQPEVISQQEVDVAKAEHEVARGEVQLAKARIALARSEVERVEVLMGYANIRAPYDGVVTDRFVDPGAMMQSATSSTGNVAPLVAVAHIDKVRVYVYVAEPDVSYVRPGDPVRVELDALPGKEFRGTVTRFATVLDPQTRTMKTEIDLANARHLIRPGMYGKAIIELSRESRALFLPTQSVHQDGEGNKYVYIVAQGRIQKAPVETGLDDGKLIQVKGLRGDEIVVLTATQSLQEGLAVKTVKASS